MTDDAPAQTAVAQPADPALAATTDAAAAAAEPVAPAADAKVTDAEAPPAAATADTTRAEDEKKEEEKPAEKKPAGAGESDPASAPAPGPEAAAPASVPTDEKPSETDVEMKDEPAEEANEPVAEPATETKAKDEEEGDKTVEPASNMEHEAATVAAEGAAIEAASATPVADKSKARRKSSGVPSSTGKKLNKKASKAKILHLDAKPGDHFFAKLKGFPPWPVVVCEEDMLPEIMLLSRPVTAKRTDGTYREDFADGGKRAAERSFPVLYLHTNEFSWITNTDLTDLDTDVVASLITTKMRKDLQNAHLIAAENNSLDYYKNLLREFEEQRLAKLEAKEAKEAKQAEAREAKQAAKAKAPKKASKAAETAADDEDGDVDMADAPEDDEAEAVVEKKAKTKKRKADEEGNTPQRSDSVKKPKIKLTNSSTPKAANGVQSPTSAKDSASKAVKVKSKSSKSKEAGGKKDKEPAAPKEPELSAEEKHVRKEKEILFLRHRLQKGLLLRDQEPKEEEMQSMSDFLAKLETFPDLEVTIIRATKINKVLKAILKLENIPKEDEFTFKPRSQSLLDKWNKILASEGPPAPANGVNGTSGDAVKGEKQTANGMKEKASEVKAEAKKETSKMDAPEKEVKQEAEPEEPASDDKPATTEKTGTTGDEAPAKVESTA